MDMKSTQRKTLREHYIEHRTKALEIEIELRHDEGVTFEKLRAYAIKAIKTIEKCRFSKVISPAAAKTIGSVWLDKKVVLVSRSEQGHYIYDVEGGARFTTTDSVTAFIYPESHRPYCDKRDAPQPINPFAVKNPYDY